jgi:bifunctional non-homologous end joining protein LigD
LRRRSHADSDSGRPETYVDGMPISKFQRCIPTRATKVPAHQDWLHEVKHDGFRMIVQRDGEGFAPSGSFIDGEASVVGIDGIADFAALYSRRHDEEIHF